MFQNLCTKKYFSRISSNVYSESMYKDMFYMYIQKNFSMISFYAYVQGIKKTLKNMHKLQNENMYKIFYLIFPKVCTKWFSLIFQKYVQNVFLYFFKYIWK